ncbi:MAG: RHS repeat-associated core domain-containing protein, partial [Anaerolineae bacterium]
TDIGFTGQRADATGLMFYQARYYSAALGRFIQADTMVPSPANPQSLNRYSYVLNSPLRYTDPTGHFTDEAIQEYLRSQYGKYWFFYWQIW